MKRLLLIFGVVLALAPSCGKGSCDLCPDATERRHVILSLAGACLPTRAENVTEGQESAVKECTLFVFSRDGRLVSRYESGAGVFDFYLTDETYDFVAVVNKPELPASPTRTELDAQPTTLAENTVGHFVMAGALPNHVIQGDEKLTVRVKRLVAKVSYTVRTAFTGTLATLPFSVDEIYLTNVAGANSLGLDAQPDGNGLWYNKLNRNVSAGGVDDLLYGRMARDLGAVDSLCSGATFYAYPNTAADSHDKDRWAPRCTRFVVKATLGGRTTYYPVTIPVTAANKHYHIDLTISNYGVDHPEDVYVEGERVEIVVTVSDWEDGGTLYGEY